MPIRRPFRALVLAALALVAAAMVCPSPSRAATPLAAVPTSAHGWHPAAISSRAALADLASRLPFALRARVRRVAVQAAGASFRRARLRDEAFVLGSPRAAAQVVRSWAGRRSDGVDVGRGGRLVFARGSASVIWRQGARVGLLILRERGSRSVLRRDALDDARYADRFLRVRVPADSWLRALAGIDEHGRVSKSTALAAFSLAYGPLPGVPVPRGHHMTIESGTLAAWWALAYRPRLTAAQRAAVNRRLGLPFARARAAAAPGSGGDRAFEPDPYYQSLANVWQTAYEGHFARPLGLTMVVGTSPDVGKAAADAQPLNTDGEFGSGQPTMCRIRMGPVGTSAEPVLQRLVLAHEVFHCFQYALLGAHTWHFPEPWIVEGTANWAAVTVDPVKFALADRLGHGSITAYLATPQTPLFARSYDAVGFWGHLADFTGALWPRVSAILNAGSDDAAFVAAGGTEQNALSSWGSSLFRIGAQAGFTMHSPVEPPSFAEREPGSLEHIVASRVAAAPYTTAQYVVHPARTAELIHVAIDGPARLLSGSTEYTNLSDAWFCVEGRDCTCPPDSTGEVPPTRPLTTPAYLGVTGRPSLGTAGVVEPATRDEFCHPHGRGAPPPRHPRPRPLGCPAGCGGSNGDPHLHPFNADPYEFQATGEFTLVRSTDGAFEIQTRQQPWGHTRNLSINTAIAMRVGSATIELDAGRSMRLVVNHRRRPLPARSLTLRGGGRVRTLEPLDRGSGNAVGISWPDGSRARIWPIDDFGVAILIAPARSLSGRLAGLLGGLGGPPGLVGRDGRPYPVDVITGDGPANSAARYGAFGESWRVRPGGSLFTYPRGKTTSSYTVRGFPFGQYDLSGAPAAQRAQAEQLCGAAGISDPAALADCLVDVLGTGDRRFASSSVALQVSAGRGTLRAAHPWTKLSSADDTATDVRASLAPSTGGGVNVGYRRDVDGSVELADVVPGVDGVALRTRSAPLSGWTSVSDPVLLGGSGLLVAGLHSDDSSDPLNGTTFFMRAGATLGAGGSVSNSVADSLGANAVLAADGATPVWSSTSGGQLVVHRGATEIDVASPGLPVASALGYDHVGELWLAWHAVGAGSADGLYMLRLDPATAQAATGSSPQHAPASNAGNVQPLLPLACAARCRVVYVDARGSTSSTLDSWSPGETAPTPVAHGTGIHSPSAAYASDGRLWVTWVSADGNRLLAKLGDAKGAGGDAQLLPPPPSHDIPDTTAALAIGERLVLATEWSAQSAEINSEWATVVDPQ